MAVSRRTFFKIVAGAAGALALGSQWPSIRDLVPEDNRPANTVATRWEDFPLVAASSDDNRMWESRIYKAPHEFNALGFLVAGPWQSLTVRVSADGREWSEWMPVEGCYCDGKPQSADGRQAAGLVSTQLSRYAQYRLTPAPGQPAPPVRIDLINSSKGSSAPVSAKAFDEPISRIQSPQPQPIISRANWGANESWRYDKEGQEIWPREYRTIQKAVVHHTATSNSDPDPAATVRAIYYYHAVSLEWGDVGYTYLIDRYGNIYEGRAGGHGVVAGHAYSPQRGSFNPSSVGIGCIGTYSTTTPTIEMKRALARLIAWRCRYIAPHGKTYFVWDYLPNIMGHRDAMPGETTCPGDTLATHLPALRGDVWWNLDYQTPQPTGSIRRVTFAPQLMSPGGIARIDIELENTGTGTMTTQGPQSGTVFNEGETFRSRGYSEIIGAFRVGVEYESNDLKVVDHPYRWGLPDALEPGQRVTITGYIKFNKTQRQSYWAGLIEEAIRWHQDKVGGAVLSVGNVERPYHVYLPYVVR